MREQLHLVLEAMPMAVGIHLTHDERWSYANPAMARLLGVAEPATLVGTPVLDVVVPEDRERVRERRQRLLRGESIGFNRTNWVTGNGTLVPVEVSAACIEYLGKAAILIIGKDLGDEHQRLLAEEASQRKDDMFRQLYAAAPDAIILVGKDGKILLSNAEAERMFGYEAGTLEGEPLESLMPSALRDAHARHREGYFAAPRWRRMGEWLDLAGQRKDGQEFPVDISLGAFSYNGRPAVLAVVRDITERKKLEASLRRTEEQLRHAQKMQAVGVLAGGVAHDFNNILSVILSYTGMLIESVTPGDPMRPDLCEIRHAGQRAEALTRQLLAFSRKQILQPRVLDLGQVVADMERMLRRILGDGCVLSVFRAAVPSKIHADQGQLEQVIMNLVVNARDAMPDGGTVSIETANVRLDEDYAMLRRLLDNRPPSLRRIVPVDSAGIREAARVDVRDRGGFSQSPGPVVRCPTVARYG